MVWSSFTKKSSEKVEKVQKRMFNLIQLHSFKYHDKLKKAKLLTLQTRRIQHRLMTMYKMKFNHIDLRTF